MGRWMQGAGQQPLQLTTGQRGVRRVRRLWQERGKPHVQQAKDGITLAFVVKVLANRPLITHVWAALDNAF